MPDFSTPEVAVNDFYLNKCWKADAQYGRCSGNVRREDTLGLCPDHIEEMRETS
jgi:hypothetical protein